MFNKPNECLGIGINYRSEIASQLLLNKDEIDFIEVSTERLFLPKINSILGQLINSKPIVLHGLSLSIGEINNVTSSYLDNLSKALDKTNAKWFSEHIAITKVEDIEIRALMPVELTENNVKKIINNIKKITAVSHRPFLLENITYYFSMPTNEMDEISFINKIVSQTDCGILLDLNNLYVNSVNHRYNPYEFLDQLPLNKIVEVHLAGCDYIFDMLVDTHASTIKKEVLSLFEYICQRTFINGVIVERDAKLNNFSELLEDLATVRKIMKQHHLL